MPRFCNQSYCKDDGVLSQACLGAHEYITTCDQVLMNMWTYTVGTFLQCNWCRSFLIFAEVREQDTDCSSAWRSSLLCAFHHFRLHVHSNNSSSALKLPRCCNAITISCYKVWPMQAIRHTTSCMHLYQAVHNKFRATAKSLEKKGPNTTSPKLNTLTS